MWVRIPLALPERQSLGFNAWALFFLSIRPLQPCTRLCRSACSCSADLHAALAGVGSPQPVGRLSGPMLAWPVGLDRQRAGALVAGRRAGSFRSAFGTLPSAAGGPDARCGACGLGGSAAGRARGRRLACEPAAGFPPVAAPAGAALASFTSAFFTGAPPPVEPAVPPVVLLADCGATAGCLACVTALLREVSGCDEPLDLPLVSEPTARPGGFGRSLGSGVRFGDRSRLGLLLEKTPGLTLPSIPMAQLPLSTN